MTLAIEQPIHHLSSPKYRTDIDGLRAIAVLSVVGFHAFPNFIESGFIGVDIFFVISGFLISSIIFSNLEHDSFSIIEFYNRRIRRIFPALITVMLASFIFGWFALMSDEYKQLGKHIAGGSIFISNFILRKESGYFDNIAETKPMLHLWSLAIEEQFYIFWPLLMAFVWKRRWSFLRISIAVAILSFFFNLYLVNKNPTAGFYSPFSRFWELMIGGLLAYLTIHKPRLIRQYQNAQSILGVLLIAVGLVAINKAQEFPSWRALVPTLGAFFVISAGNNAWLNGNVLSNKILVWFGLISYPLYLWHWPLLSFARILESELPSLEIRISVVLISVILAWLTYRLVEKPMRFGGRNKLKIVTLLASMVAIGSLGFICKKTDGLQFRSFAKKTQAITDAAIDWDYPDNLISLKKNEIVYFANKNESPEIMFFGDSHIEQLSPRIVHLTKHSAIPSISFFTGAGCPPIPQVYEDEHPHCENLIANFLKLTEEIKTIKTIVVGAYWNSYLGYSTSIKGVDYYFRDDGGKAFLSADEGKEKAKYSLRKFLNLLSEKYKVYVLLDNAVGKEFNPKEIIAPYRKNPFSMAPLPSLQTTQPTEKQIEANNKLRLIAKEAGVNVIDQISHLCPNESCVTVNKDGKPTYRDSGHMRPYFVIENCGYIDKVLSN